ncbi:hypothetical protein [Terriglobus roseus]|uniref:hypothetical protein n=1 Tax=Terriglobus roseus TaxID=392734 RepID=UPI0002E80796|nr:hypothetical protein [Terriglobus roseus]
MRPLQPRPDEELRGGGRNPWQNIAIAYVGSKGVPENKPLYDTLHGRGVKVMVATAPTYDKLPMMKQRAAAYRKVIEDGADIVESDRPIEVADALKVGN